MYDQDSQSALPTAGLGHDDISSLHQNLHGLHPWGVFISRVPLQNVCSVANCFAMETVYCLLWEPNGSKRGGNYLNLSNINWHFLCKTFSVWSKWFSVAERFGLMITPQMRLESLSVDVTHRCIVDYSCNWGKKNIFLLKRLFLKRHWFVDLIVQRNIFA